MREWLRRAWFFFRRRQLESELIEEIEFHRAMKARELELDGLARDDARLAAQRALGNDLLARDRARDVWVPPWIQDLAQDLRFAGRLLLKERAFTLVAVIALGLGIGVNNTLFTIVNAFCIRGLPITDPHQVVSVALQDKEGRSRALSYPEFEDLRDAESVASLAAFSDAPAALRDENRAADRFRRTYISAAAFRLIGEAPAVGRDFLPDDDRPGAPPVVILGSGVWKSRYAGDPAIVGRTVVIDGEPTSVIGVMREGFGFPHSADLWQPLAAMPALITQGRGARTLGVFGRLTTGATVADARAEMEAFGQRWQNDHRASNEGMRVTVVPINERYVQRLTHPAWLAFGITGLLMVLIASANVANLLLARSVARAREIAIRASLGATRRRVVRQLLAESALLALLGGLVGFALSIISVRLMDRAVPASVRSYWLDFSMDGVVFTVLAVVCLATVFLFGLVPALHVSTAQAADALKDGGRTGIGGLRARRWTAAFLTVEFALTMILLAGVGDTLQAYLAREKADRVFDPSPLLTMMVSLPPQAYPTPAQRRHFYDRLGERLSGIGALSDSALASALPLGGGGARNVEIERHAGTDLRPLTGIRAVAVSERYFAALGLQMRAGRAFAPTDGTTGQLNVIVNEQFATTHLGGAPLGRRVRFPPSNTATAAAPWFTIVGVAPSVRQSLRPEPEAVIYVPFRLEPPATAALIVRAPSDPLSVTPVLRGEVRALDPDLPIYRVLSMQEAMAETSWNSRVSTVAITIISLIAFSLALVGLYAVTAHAVAQRTPEIGVRMALGAPPVRIGWIILRRALWQLAVGLTSGIACTYAWARLFGASAWFDPVNLLGVVLLVVVVATTACLVPAWRAMRVDPVLALRME
jgi:predicted permease